MILCDIYESGEVVSTEELTDQTSGKDIGFDSEQEAQEYIDTHRWNWEFAMPRVSETSVRKGALIPYSEVKKRQELNDKVAAERVKDCPFCGGKAEPTRTPPYSISCSACGIHMTGLDKAVLWKK
jgi:hypothetical protein